MTKSVLTMISFKSFIQIISLMVIGVNSDPVIYNTTVAATNIESTIGTPAILIDPTTTSSQNTTDAQYEVSLKLSKWDVNNGC